MQSILASRQSPLSGRHHAQQIARQAQAPSPPAPSQTLIVGISGPSSSGKSTLARLLRSIFNIPASASTHNRSISLFILHEDDFYKTDKLIPKVTVSSSEYGTRELQDWDCADSINTPLFESTLRHVKEHGTLPADSFSKEDQNQLGESHVPDTHVEECREGVKSWLAALPSSPSSTPVHLTLCVIDGFLLYPAPGPTPSIPHSITSLLDLRLFLRCTHALAKSRREARRGYVTLEGFWTDPPGYVDEVVWPNYVKEHGWMFEGGDVDRGSVREKVVGDEEVVVGPGKGDMPMEEVLEWGVGVVKARIEEFLRVGKDGA